ncbi:hypothetical protein L1889_10980 [Paenalcaligenes niemegkensis]|uniref:hypothetical protein n=1 Tax=Paenalcaligenes niemegkensis TaxID=2895469 RepID=UPI001EE7F6F9|nr:hypothetical protein [Paenalcaligenes niemegkensis]MCQ9617155.1 hypothetical protein [Paenalcaligenes niemegkensis]
MSTRRNNLDREIRIELLRAQAAIERGELCRHVRNFSEDLRPGNLFHSFSGLGRGSRLSQWSNLLLTSTGRYPMLVSVLSALVGGIGGKGLKASALGLIGWRLAKTFILRSARQRKDAARSKRVMGPL